MVYWVPAASGFVGVQVSSVWSGLHAQFIGTVGPAIPPVCRSMYCSIPAIIGCPKVSWMVVVGATAVAAGVGLTEVSVAAAGAVESLQAPSVKAAIPARPPSEKSRNIGCFQCVVALDTIR
jgi:hypothetical protein